MRSSILFESCLPPSIRCCPPTLQPKTSNCLLLGCLQGGRLLCRRRELNVVDHATCAFAAPCVAAPPAFADAPPVRFASTLDAFEIQTALCAPYEVLVPEQPTPEGNVEPHRTIPVLTEQSPRYCERPGRVPERCDSVSTYLTNSEIPVVNRLTCSVASAFTMKCR